MAMQWPFHDLRRTVAPAALISLADIKAHCRVDHDDDDAYLTALVATAQSMLDGPDGMVGRALVTQTWRLRTSRLTGKQRLMLPVNPVIGITSIKFYDAADVEQTVSDVPGYFRLVANLERAFVEPRETWLAMFDRPDAVEVVFTAGFGDVADVPPNLIHAAKMMVSHWYENREAVSERAMVPVPLAAETLVNLDRVGWIRS